MSSSSADSSSPSPSRTLAKWSDVMTWPEGAEVKTFKAACHCRKFTFEIDHPALDAWKPAQCNCTFCTKIGAIMIFGPEKTLVRLDETSAPLKELSTFKPKKLPTMHYFCPDCGSYLFWTGMGLFGANARMIDGIEVDKLSLVYIDGKSR